MAIPKSLRAAVRELDTYRCAYCQSPEILAITPFEIDHIVPQKAGGKTELHNLRQLWVKLGYILGEETG